MPDLMDGRVYEIVVFGSDDEQSVINVLHYIGDDEAPVENPSFQDGLQQFQTRWRSDVLPSLASTYEVLLFECKSIIAARSDAAGNYWFEYDEQDVRQGEPEDVGGLDTDATPSFVSLGIRKVASSRDRSFRGSFRVGPVVEADTTAPDHNNFNDAAKARHDTLATTFAVPLDVPGGGSFLLKMVVASRKRAFEAGGNFPENFTSEVVRLVPNDFVTSQVSRKKRFRLG